MIATIPTELVQQIVEEIDDTRSLKSCSLVASLFRVPSQRMLLDTLSLGDRSPQYLAAKKLLIDSPHIIPYIRALRFRVDWLGYATAASVEAFRFMLNTLTRVRRLAILGIPASTWDSLHRVTCSILDFIRTPAVEEVYISNIAHIPTSVLSELISSVRTLAFKSVTIQQEEYGTIIPVQAQGEPQMQALLLLLGSNGLRAWMQPHLLANLHTLTLIPSDVDWNLLSAASSTLQHLRFDSTVTPTIATTRSWKFPQLSSLRTLSVLATYNGDMTWLPSALSSLLPSLTAGTLRSIHIIYTTRLRASQQYYLQPSIFSLMDSTLHESLPACRVQCSITFGEETPRKPQFGRFVAFVKGGMPKLSGSGRLGFVHLGLMELREYRWYGL
ncbi:hypothetical protein R3P38DRAFT_696243 [Favolaschia claudopus]|uniref:F-box domain-containing protein n=1 Tax=Favolaschia claudopus TaxID=2862362 RepID=A0AAW0EBH2_9AGAR